MEKKASLVFNKGLNCAQSVLLTHGKKFFKSDDLALKLASGFGGGISGRGQTCGAVIGSLMVLGLHFGYSSVENPEDKTLLLEKNNEFLNAFEKRFGALDCKQLLRVDISSTEGRNYARENGLFQQACPAFIDGASEILEYLIGKYEKEIS